MEISMYHEIFVNKSLYKVIQSLCDGIRANIPYSSTQVYSVARVTASIINGASIALFDRQHNNSDTVGLIMELENGVRAAIETGYDVSQQHGAGIVVVYSL